MNTLDWIKKKIETVKDESGKAWHTRLIYINADDVDKLLAVVDAVRDSGLITPDIQRALMALDES